MVNTTVVVNGYHFVNYKNNKNSPKNYIQVNINKSYSFKITKYTKSLKNLKLNDCLAVSTSLGIRNLVVTSIKRASKNKVMKLRPILKCKQHSLDISDGQKVKKRNEYFLIVH